MKKRYAAQTAVTIHATASNVWDGLTKPEMIKKYFFGTDTETDWKKGSPITFSGVWEGKPYKDKGVVTDIAPGKFVSYSYWSSFSGKPDIPENYGNVRYELSGTDNEITVTVTQEGLDNEQQREHTISNWNMVLGNLKKLLEEGK